MTAALRLERDTATLVAGTGALASTVAAAASLVTYEGVGLIGYRTTGCAALSVLLLIATLALGLIPSGRPTGRRAAVGLSLAIGAYPATFLVLMLTEVVTGLLGISR